MANTTARLPQQSLSQVRAAIEADLQNINSLVVASENLFGLEIKVLFDQNTSPFKCNISLEHKILTLAVNPECSEVSATVYYALHRLGFLFPHPERGVVLPKFSELQDKVTDLKKTGVHFKPRFRYRGFHLHTQHPSEFVSGFFMGQKKVAQNYLLWLRRNMQNTLQIQMLRSEQVNESCLSELLQEARASGLYVGLSVSFTFRQQKSLCLLPFWSAVSGAKQKRQLQESLESLKNKFEFDYLTVELGSSEFTATSYEKTLLWLKWTEDFLQPLHRQLFVKVHVSSNQVHKKYGNFNFLPQYAEPEIGVLPHTVFFYALTDKNAPLYGRKNFADILQFMKDQTQKRPTWFYPETSYYVGLDIDIPLFLVPYLTTRSRDIDTCEELGIEGHLNFTTGLEFGYWLNDWTTALLSLSDYKSEAFIALKLLGETNLEQWNQLNTHQEHYLKELGLVAEITSANLIDELLPKHQILKRTLIRDVVKHKESSELVVNQLEEALNTWPKISSKITEIQELSELLKLRFEFAFLLRKSMLHNDFFKNSSAEKTLEQASVTINQLNSKNAYKETLAHQKITNPTSYSEGYARTALSLHFWHRELAQARGKIKNPFFKNIYNPFKILF